MRQQTRYNTYLRKYIGEFEISGSTWRVYHDAGHTDLNTTSGALTHRYYVRDYLGSVRAVFDLYGNLEQTNDYNVTGIPSSRHLGNADVHKHTGKEFQGFNGLAWYDNNARYYDPILARFTTQDPLAEKYPWLSPYNHCANNPMKFIDPDGSDASVIYNLTISANGKLNWTSRNIFGGYYLHKLINFFVK